MNETSITHNYTRKTYQVRCAFYNQLCNYLPSIGFEKELENARLSVFVEGYMHRALSNIEAWKLLWMYNKKLHFSIQKHSLESGIYSPCFRMLSCSQEITSILISFLYASKNSNDSALLR